MSAQKVQLAGAQETLLYTLYHRTLDSGSEEPLLADRYAPVVLGQIDYDRRKLRRKSGDRFVAVLRARRLDAWTRERLADHPDGIVLHLGCGLDSRAFRLDPPSTVRWYDLDYPEVIDLRRRLYPERAGYQMIASSVTDPDWLLDVPNDAPVLVIAEGLLMYLAEDDVRRLIDRLLGHFTSGQLLFDAMAPWVGRLSKLLGWTLGDPRALENWSPRLQLVDASPVVSEFADIPPSGQRALHRTMNRIPAFRNSLRLVRYEVIP